MYFRGILSAVLVVISLLSLSFDSQAREPRNLDLVKQDLVRYHDTGEYDKDMARVVLQAEAYLKARIENNKSKSKKLAIVLDIDETALSNYPYLKSVNFGGTVQAFDEAIAQGNDPVIQPTLTLYQYAKSRGIAVFFITARPEKYKEATASNLEAAGYKDYNGLYLRPADYHEKSITAFKAGVRKQITEQGYDIVLNLSDQTGDLRGDYADKAFKLPDPYYLVP